MRLQFTPPHMQIVRQSLVLWADASIQTSAPPGGVSSWNDLSGNTNTITLVNYPAWEPMNNGVFVFDGVADYGSLVQGTSPFRQSSQITYDFWIYRFSGFLVMGTSTSGGQGSGGVYVEDTQFLFSWTPSNPASDTIISATTASNTGVWVHFAFTMNYTNGTYAMYRNGAALSTSINRTVTTWAPTTSYNRALVDRIGGRYVNSALYSNCRIGDVRIYNRALSATEIAHNYNMTKARFTDITTANILLWWDSTNPASYPGSGTSWNDLSGNANHGTTQNSPVFNTTYRWFNFNGSNQWVQRTSTASLNTGTSTRTVSIWCRPYTTTPGMPMIKLVTGNSGDYWFTNTGGRWQAQSYSGTGVVTADVSDLILTYEWYNLVVTFQSNSSLKFYVNNVLIGEDTSPGPITSSAHNLNVGTYLSGNSHFNGDIGHVAIWNAILSTTQLTDNYNILRTKFNNRGFKKGIFGFGVSSNTINLVSAIGVASSGTSGVGTARSELAAAGYGGDKAIFGYGVIASVSSLTNLVSNVGVLASDTTGVGTARKSPAAAGYGVDKAIFGYGVTTGPTTYRSMTNLVSNVGVVASDTTGVGTARSELAAAGYGGDKAIFGYGFNGTVRSMTNLVSNVGVVASDTTGVGSSRRQLAAAGYGGDKAIFGYGYTTAVTSITNLVSNTGVVATDTTGVGTTRYVLAATNIGYDRAIFGWGSDFINGDVSMTNLVSNTGVVATDTAGVGNARRQLAAASYG